MASFFDFFLGNSGISLYKIFYFLTYFISAIYLLKNITSLKKQTFPKVQFLYFISSITAYCLLIYINYSATSIWGDEYTQFIFSIESPTKSPIYLAANEQQPALDYILSHFSSFLFGVTEFAVKFSNLFHSLILFLTLPFIVYSLTKRHILALLSCYLLLNHNIISFYLLESRPYYLGLTHSFFFLYFFIKFNSQKVKTDADLLTVSSIILVSSIALQSIILIASCFIGYLLINGNKENIKRYSKQMIPLLLYFITISYPVVYYSDKKNQFHSLFKIDITSILSNFYYNLSELKILIFESWPINLLLITFPIFKILTKKKRARVLYCFTSLILFFLLLYISYNLIINWPIHHRYFYIGYSLLIVLFFASINNLSKRKGHTVSFLIVLAIIMNYRVNNTVTRKNVYLDWKTTYNYINKEIKENDRILRFGLPFIGGWIPDLYTSYNFYLDEKHHEKIIQFANIKTYQRMSVLEHYYVSSNKRGGNLILLVDEYSNNFDFISKIKDHKRIKVKKVNNIYLVTVKSSGTMVETTKSFMQLLSNIDIPDEFKFYPLRTKLELEVKSNQNVDAFNTLKKIKELKIKPENQTEDKYFDKKKYVSSIISYYEDLLKK